MLVLNVTPTEMRDWYSYKLSIICWRVLEGAVAFKCATKRRWNSDNFPPFTKCIRIFLTSSNVLCLLWLGSCVTDSRQNSSQTTTTFCCFDFSSVNRNSFGLRRLKISYKTYHCKSNLGWSLSSTRWEKNFIFRTICNFWYLRLPEMFDGLW